VTRAGFKPEYNGYESDKNSRLNERLFQTQRNPLPERVLKNLEINGDPGGIQENITQITVYQYFIRHLNADY